MKVATLIVEKTIGKPEGLLVGTPGDCIDAFKVLRSKGGDGAVRAVVLSHQGVLKRASFKANLKPAPKPKAKATPKAKAKA